MLQTTSRFRSFDCTIVPGTQGDGTEMALHHA